MRGVVYHAEAMGVLRGLLDSSIDLAYLDPPFNTGKDQRRDHTVAVRDDGASRVGFAGRRYRTEKLGSRSFGDRFDDYWAFLTPHLEQVHRVLKPTGSLYLHLDYREVHYAKVLLDEIFGRSSFLNEIIWAYDYGGRPKNRWPAKHDNILFYVKQPGAHYFDQEAIGRIPYMAPGLAGPEKAARGKLPTDTWWHTIVSPTGKEKLGYPTQKPLGVLRRIVQASCPVDGLALDVFAGSGTTGGAALERGARFILADQSDEAIAVMRRRFAAVDAVHFCEGFAPFFADGGEVLADGCEPP